MLSKAKPEQTTGASNPEYFVQANKKIINQNDK